MSHVMGWKNVQLAIASIPTPDHLRDLVKVYALNWQVEHSNASIKMLNAMP